MRIRPIELRDRQAWAAMRAELWPEEDPDWLAHETLQHFGGSEIGPAIFIAEDSDARPVGFLELALRTYAEGCEASPVPFIEAWYVSPLVRFRGVGRRLVEAAENWARIRGFREIGSDTQLSNAASQEAHAKLGFEEAERIVAYRKTL